MIISDNRNHRHRCPPLLRPPDRPATKCGESSDVILGRTNPVPGLRSIAGEDDKLARDAGGELRLVAKDDERAWIVPDDDPIVPAVQALARRVHLALGCSHHGLVDVRVDPAGRPWFLEAGPYCSFAPSSVVVTMAAAAGVGVVELFADAVAVARAAPPVATS